MTPILSQRCNPSRGSARLTWPEVQAIRLWARSEGFGLPTAEQVRALMAMPVYDQMTRSALREVVLGETWVDLAYDPTVPVETVNPARVNPMLAFLVLMWVLIHHRSCLVTLLPGVLAGAYDTEHTAGDVCSS